MVTLLKVQNCQKTLLYNILQKYLYEMTNYNDLNAPNDPNDLLMDKNGNYQYEYFDAYFLEETRKALFIYSDGVLAGFALINSYSYLNKKVDYALAEFTIFPMYRKKKVATDAMNKIFSMYNGEWEIKYNEKNIAAKNLYNKVTMQYAVKIFYINNDETVLSFKVA